MVTAALAVTTVSSSFYFSFAVVEMTTALVICAAAMMAVVAAAVAALAVTTLASSFCFFSSAVAEMEAVIATLDVAAAANSIFQTRGGTLPVPLFLCVQSPLHGHIGLLFIKRIRKHFPCQPN